MRQAEWPAQGGGSCQGLGCTDGCWGGIPAQEWGAGCCGEELPCTGYFWPRNLSSVSRPWEIKPPQGGRGWALLEPRPSSQGFGANWEKPNCLGRNAAKNAIFNRELNVHSRGNLLHQVWHLCCFLIHFLPASLFPVAGIPSFPCCVDALSTGAGPERAGRNSPCSGEPQLGIIKASLTPCPAAGPGFYTSGGLNSGLGSKTCWERVIPCAAAIPRADRGIIFVAARLLLSLRYIIPNSAKGISSERSLGGNVLSLPPSRGDGAAPAE